MLSWACSPSISSDNEVVVFAAASLRDVMTDIGGAFEKTTSTRVVFNFAGSNVLAQQILATSRADLYLSANVAWMDTVARAGRIVEGSRAGLLTNTLAVIAHPQSTWAFDTPCDLQTLDFRYLAIGDPRAVPAGRYAAQWLASEHCNNDSLWDLVRPRTAPSADVRSALTLVEARPDVLGVVYYTDYLVAAQQTRLVYAIPDAAGPAIRYEIAQLTDRPPSSVVRSFLDYLTTDTTRALFTAYGFTPLLPPATP